MSANGSVPAGTRVGRYEIVSLLRQGGMGEVYTARDSNLGRRVALKILPTRYTSDPDRVERFVREARASSTLNHPSIVSVHDAGADGGVHFLAMELIDGKPLSEWMRKRRPIEQRVEVMAQVADGLAQAHDAGIVHRDLKPDNIMVTGEGRAKIVDFGVAKLTERLGERSAITGLSTPTSRVGTTAYMAPEQIEARTLDRRTDVFSFGIVLYEVLVGKNPFVTPHYADTLHNVMHLQPPLDAIPAALRRVVRRCLSKEPERRYDSMRDAALDLREAVGDLRSVPRRKWMGIAFAALLLVAIAAAATWVVASRRDSTTQPAMTMKRLTNSGRVTTAAISPDGKYLVHAVKEGAQEALYVKQIATGTLTRIAGAAPQHYAALQVSADGNYAYYIAVQRDEPNVGNIDQIPLLGGAPRRIASDTEYSFSVSPDGQKVVFRRFNAFVREHQITIAAIDGGGEEVVLRRKHPRFAEAPVWTPDGEAITVHVGNARDNRNNSLQRLDLKTRRMERVVLPRFAGVASYAWLPDGSGALVAAYDKEQPPQVWFVPKGETTARKVTSEVSAYYGVNPAVDGRSFSAVREVTDVNVVTMELAEGRNGATRELTTGFGNWVGGGGVRWANGEVLFSGIAGGMSTFFAVDTKGGAPRRLIHNMPAWNLTVSPDGSHIAFISDKTGTNQIWIADASGANARQLTKGGNVGAPAFTPDGRSIVYINFDESQYAWRMPVDGSTPPARLTNAPTSRALPSPDGKYLLVRLRSRDPKTALWRTAVMPMAGGEPRYFEAPLYGGRIVMQWHPNGRTFVYLDDMDGVSNVWMQDLGGGAARQLTFFDAAEIFTFDLSSDGKSVALARGESTKDAVLIENFR